MFSSPPRMSAAVNDDCRRAKPGQYASNTVRSHTVNGDSNGSRYGDVSEMGRLKPGNTLETAAHGSRTAQKLRRSGNPRRAVSDRS